MALLIFLGFQPLYALDCETTAKKILLEHGFEYGKCQDNNGKRLYKVCIFDQDPKTHLPRIKLRKAWAFFPEVETKIESTGKVWKIIIDNGTDTVLYDFEVKDNDCQLHLESKNGEENSLPRDREASPKNGM